MATKPLALLIQRLRGLLATQPGGLTDAELLDRYSTHRDEAAFEALVWRYGPLVLGVGRRMMRHEQDMEDVFQATFLTLVRKAGSIAKRESLGSWLHKVAYRIALRARAASKRQGLQQQNRVETTAAEPFAEPCHDDLRAVLDEEVNNLPARYRAPFVLCYLEGKTNAEAARQLGCAMGTIASRLSRARERLRKRLSQRGVALPSATVTGVLLENVSSAAVPAALVQTTLHSALAFGVGTTAAGLVPAHITAWSEGVIRAMFMTKVKLTASALLALGLVGTGLGIVSERLAATDDPVRPARNFAAAAPAAEQQAQSRSRLAEKPAQPPQEALDQFHKMSPEERLSHVAQKAGAEKAFVSVVREDLNPTVVERGNVESADAIDILSRVKTTVKWVVEDGTAVKKGERLIQLDDSALRAQLRTQKMALEQAQTARLTADVNLKLARKENELAIRSGELSLKVARIEMRKDDGKDADRKEILELRIEQAQLALETAKLRGRARELKADAYLKAKVSAEEQEVKRTSAIEAQLAECVIKAPQAGLVIYHVPERSRFGSPGEVVAAGEPVREGQKLMQVCGLKRFTVVTRIHEADIARVRVGQAAQLLVDAFPGRELGGRVKEVSPVASTQDWLARHVKVYPVVVEPTASLPGLKPGLSAEIRIAEARVPKVLQVPLGSVARIGREPFCYVRIGKELQERKVTLGARSALNVEIKEGLKEGEEVLRAPGR
jgi:RNA polymerase sigma factor (sigma-70 family)